MTAVEKHSQRLVLHRVEVVVVAIGVLVSSETAAGREVGKVVGRFAAFVAVAGVVVAAVFVPAVAAVIAAAAVAAAAVAAAASHWPPAAFWPAVFAGT